MRNQLGIQRRGLQRAISLGVFTCLVASTNLAVFVRVAEAGPNSIISFDYSGGGGTICSNGTCSKNTVEPSFNSFSEKMDWIKKITGASDAAAFDLAEGWDYLSKEEKAQKVKELRGKDGFTQPDKSSDDSCSDGSCSGNGGGGGGGGGGLGGLLSKIGPMMMQMLPLLMMMLMMKNNQNKNNTPLPPTDFGALATATPIPTITLVPTIAPTASLPPTDFGPLPTNTPSAVVSTTPAVAPGLTPAVVITGTPTITSVVQASSVISAF